MSNLETIFWVKILKFFNMNPGSGMEKIRIQDPGKTSWIRNTDDRIPVEPALDMLLYHDTAVAKLVRPQLLHVGNLITVS
jgi:hypothetical protein